MEEGYSYGQPEENELKIEDLTVKSCFFVLEWYS